MGGGYFLCRYLNTAVKLARYQRRISLALDDIQLAMKCAINEAYNYIHAGEISRAKRLIRQTWKEAKERVVRDGSMKVIVGMCRSALWFARCVEKAGLREDEVVVVQEDLLARDSHTKTTTTTATTATTATMGRIKRQATRDDYLRIRIVTSK
mmetsp:Transcript_14351/g.26937  ORF Transcript_14351/g.26937 Transcript_14351/m.26937 type:complete len:153 (+) Transcript_14351:1353-1811(+)